MDEIKIKDSHLLLQEQSRVQQEHPKLKSEKKNDPVPGSPAPSIAPIYY